MHRHRLAQQPLQAALQLGGGGTQHGVRASNGDKARYFLVLRALASVGQAVVLQPQPIAIVGHTAVRGSHEDQEQKQAAEGEHEGNWLVA